MPKVAVVAKLTAQPGKRDELVAVLSEVVASAAGEPGTEVYSMNTDKSEADVVWFFELYADDAALAAHSGSDAMKTAGPKLAGLVAGRPELHLLEPVVGKGLPV